MKNNKSILIRSSAAEILTYIFDNGENSNTIFEIRYEDENIWLTQKMMAELYGVSVANINQHIKRVFDDRELDENSTIKDFLIVQKEGNREITRSAIHYNLQMIIAVGFKINNEKAVQFRKWANNIVKEYTVKGWVIDDERLKRGTYLSDKYFEEQLERIREIRISERKFYQKITDLYATASDYDSSSLTTKRFFANVQNKVHFAISGHTAAEIVYLRADSTKKNMGLTTWSDAPSGKIKKSDVIIAKNYLSGSEMKSLELLVSSYLDYAESMASRHIPLTMLDWEKRLNGFINLFEYNLLKDKGKITAEIAKLKAESEFEKYRIIQDKTYKSDFDRFLELQEKNNKIKDEN